MKCHVLALCISLSTPIPVELLRLHAWPAANHADATLAANRRYAASGLPEPKATSSAQSVPVRTVGVSAQSSVGALQAAPRPGGRPDVDDDARVSWLRQHAFVVRTEDPADDDFTDLAPLKRMLAGVRVVGLGEQTHGTREFFRMKHRLVAFLVREMGFRTFALEASQGGCEAINDYVTGRSGDGDAALNAQGFWMWDTEEVREMLAWMRSYNAAAPSSRQVQFVGVDFQYRERSQTAVLMYLRRVAPQRVAATESLFSTTPEYFPVFLSNDGDAKARAMKQIGGASGGYLELLGFLTLHEQDMVRQSSRADYGQALRHARLLAQYAHWFSAGGPSRDYSMADNLVRIVEADASGAGVVLWAHNSHVAVTGRSAGHYLRQVYGQGYYALGLAFGEGQFQAYDLDATPRPRLAEFTLPDAPPGTVDWYLARVGFDRYILDLRDAAPDSVAGWLSSPQRMRLVGTVYSRTGPMFSLHDVQYWPHVAIRREFDAILFIRHTTRARPR